MYKKIITIIVVFLFLLHPPLEGVTAGAEGEEISAFESEKSIEMTEDISNGGLYNNTSFATARTIDSDENINQSLSGTVTERWYKYTCNGATGYVNIWLGNIPTGTNYDLGLYNANHNLLKTSSLTGDHDAILRYWFNPSDTYYMRVYTVSGQSTSNYLIRLKMYDSKPEFNHQCSFTGNLSNVKYYTASQISTYDTLVHNAASTWVNPWNGATNTYLLTSFTKGTSAANVHFYLCAHSLEDDLVGLTHHYKNSSLNSPSSYENVYLDNWGYCVIEIDKTKLNTYTNSNKQGVFAHEFGHCFGLYHCNDNVYSIMCQVGSGRLTYWPEVFDTQQFNAKYGSGN